MIDLTNGLPDMTSRAKEGFRRGEYHTSDYHMWLVDRQAPSPNEKEIIESVPYMQGSYDFSNLLGERVYDNRVISYEFEILQRDYERRKINQTVIENWLKKESVAPLYDDHAEGYYYMAKCISVNTVDSNGGLRVSVDFDAYPFKIGELEEGHDIWDEFNFELDASIINDFTINGTQQIDMYNIGSASVAPKILTSAPMTIVKGNTTYQVPIGESKNDSFRLMPGSNPLTITGNGRIKFIWYKELL